MTYTPLPQSARARLFMQRGPVDLMERLEALGWTWAESASLPGNGQTNVYTHQIVFSPTCLRRASRRDRFYVAPHECGHALNMEAGGRAGNETLYLHRPSLTLAKMLKLENKAAEEVIAEAVAYNWRRTTERTSWIGSSIVWHLRRKIRYRWSHIKDPRTTELALLLLAGAGTGTYWAWTGGRLVAQQPA